MAWTMRQADAVDLMDSLLDKKMPYDQAWELARELWAFLPSEDED